MSKLLFTQEYFAYFSLSDPAGILFFQNVFELAHQTFEDYIKQSDIGWGNWFQNPTWAAPLVHCDSHFVAPIKCGENIKIDLFLEKTTKSSFTLSYKLTQFQKQCCEVTTTHVFVSKETQSKIDIPTQILDMFL
ncbi:MAG: acyl-CoA thioesterase [Bdellovibrionaceae bacterium]|nr:acyl-CoA thioesterase [Pseudobdellovibrionaceae bacterium]